MPPITIVACPKCGNKFPIEDALVSQIEEKYKNELDQKVAEIHSDYLHKNKLLAERETLLSLQQANIDNQVNEKIKVERASLERAAQQKATAEFEQQIKLLNAENETKGKQVQELRNTQIENVQLKRKLDERENELKLEYEEKLSERLRVETGSIHKRETEAVELKLREKDEQLNGLKEQIEQMKRKADQGSTQLQGEVQELVLEELLRETFPFDTVEEVAKGVKGADCIQTVRNRNGVECGRIIYESKRTKSFSESWVPKLKADALEAKADICAIATEAMPGGVDKIGQIDGVWVCGFHEVKGMAMVLREGLIQVQSVSSAQSNKGEKMQMLYDYLTGNEFRMHLEAIVEGFSTLQEGYNDEKFKMIKIWKEREKQLAKVLLNTVSFYGSIKGIAGSSVPDIKRLESPKLGELE